MPLSPPIVLAKASNTSPERLGIKNSCKNSIPIPHKITAHIKRNRLCHNLGYAKSQKTVKRK